MNDDSVFKRVIERNPEGILETGRPMIRWKDSVLEDNQKLE